MCDSWSVNSYCFFFLAENFFNHENIHNNQKYHFYRVLSLKWAILGRFSKFSNSNRFVWPDMAKIHTRAMENHSHDPWRFLPTFGALGPSVRSFRHAVIPSHSRFIIRTHHGFVHFISFTPGHRCSKKWLPCLGIIFCGDFRDNNVNLFCY